MDEESSRHLQHQLRGNLESCTPRRRTSLHPRSLAICSIKNFCVSVTKGLYKERQRMCLSGKKKSFSDDHAGETAPKGAFTGQNIDENARKCTAIQRNAEMRRPEELAPLLPRTRLKLAISAYFYTYSARPSQQKCLLSALNKSFPMNNDSIPM